MEVHFISSDKPFFVHVFQIGDIIDGRDETMGAWFEAKIVKILKAPVKKDVSTEETSMEVEMEIDQNENKIKDCDQEGKSNTDSVENTSDNKKDMDVNNTVQDVSKEDTNKSSKAQLEDGSDDGFLYHIIYNG